MYDRQHDSKLLIERWGSSNKDDVSHLPRLCTREIEKILSELCESTGPLELAMLNFLFIHDISSLVNALVSVMKGSSSLSKPAAT